MNKKFLIMAVLLLVAIPAIAELTVDDTVSPAYLKNSGYSDSSIWTARKTVASINGEELKPPVEKEFYNLPVIKQVRRFFTYIDPALDENTFYNDHNVNFTTRYDDLH